MSCLWCTPNNNNVIYLNNNYMMYLRNLRLWTMLMSITVNCMAMYTINLLYMAIQLTFCIAPRVNLEWSLSICITQLFQLTYNIFSIKQPPWRFVNLFSVESWTNFPLYFFNLPTELALRRNTIIEAQYIFFWWVASTLYL